MEMGRFSYMLRPIRTRARALPRRFRKLRVPGEVLRAVDAAPVPVGVHDAVDEVLVVDGGAGRVVDGWGAGRGDAQGGGQGEGEREFHCGWEMGGAELC